MKNLLPAIGYYGLIKPLSLLPISVLYMLSNGIYVLIYHLFGYRKKVVFSNLQGAFPEKSEQEIATIASQFYRHLCDLVVESIKGFSISEAEVHKRYKVVNPEVARPYFEAGRSVIYTAGHYNNWEWSTLSTPGQLDHTVVGIYTKLASPFFEKIFLESRTRYGMVGVTKKKVRETFSQDDANGKLTGTIFAIDQGSMTSKRVYWMDFLGRETAVMFGAEKYARDYNLPVIYFTIRKVKRGFYELTSEVLTDTPNEMPYGAITETFTRKLEAQIRKAPQYWLWTHKRWKRSRKPEEELHQSGVKQH